MGEPRPPRPPRAVVTCTPVGCLLWLALLAVAVAVVRWWWP